MEKHRSLVPHDPPYSYGDSHRVCVATILGLQPEDVPHFYDPPESDGEKRVADFLSQYGLKQGHVLYPGDLVVEDIIRSIGTMMPGIAAILGGKSAKGCGHSVVIMDGEVFNDPSGSGIIGPFDEDGYFWVTLFVAQPDFAQRAA